MTWKPKKQAMEASTVEELWEKYGTWFTGAVAVVLAVVLVVMLVNRWTESRLRKGQSELEMIEIKLAQVMYRNGEFAAGETLLQKLKADKVLSGVDRAQVDLELAYLAQEKGDVAEALKRFKTVEADGLYAFEAKRMTALLEKLQKEPGGVPTPAKTPK
jgi:hypothetical protein